MATVEISFKDADKRELGVYTLPVTPGGPQIEVMINGFENWRTPPRSFTVKLRAESGDDLLKGRITALENKVNRWFQHQEDFLQQENYLNQGDF